MGTLSEQTTNNPRRRGTSAGPLPSHKSSNERYLLSRKYQFMEMNLQKRASGLKEKIPEIQKTLDTVQFLQLRKVGRSPLDARNVCFNNTSTNQYPGVISCVQL